MLPQHRALEYIPMMMNDGPCICAHDAGLKPTLSVSACTPSTPPRCVPSPPRSAYSTRALESNRSRRDRLAAVTQQFLGVEQVKAAIANIDSGGCTDLSAGYFVGLSVASRSLGDGGATVLQCLGERDLFVQETSPADSSAGLAAMPMHGWRHLTRSLRACRPTPEARAQG